MKRGLVFGLDVDGVLRDMVGSILRVYNSKFNTNVKREEFMHYDLQKQFPHLPQANDYFFKGDVGRDVLLNALPIPGTLEAFNLLQDMGKVYIITSQKGYDNVKYTLDWLWREGFKTDQICFLSNKSMIYGLDYFVDDNPIKFKNCHSRNGILIDMPYNRDCSMSELSSDCHCVVLRRCKDLLHFATTLQAYEKEFLL